MAETDSWGRRGSLQKVGAAERHDPVIEVGFQPGERRHLAIAEDVSHFRLAALGIEVKLESRLESGFDVHGNPAATPGQKRPFLLDPLLR